MRIQNKRDTSQNWENNNPILLSGEFGYDITNKLVKIGDGLTHWNDLTYCNYEEFISQSKKYTDDVIKDLIGGAPSTLDTIYELAKAIQDNQSIIDSLNSSITNKVDKVEGKQLSTNDFTNDLKNKLSIAYDHSQKTSGNPHNVTKSDVGLGNVGNYKSVSVSANQGLTDAEKTNARVNIGAGTGNSNFSGDYADLSGKPTLGTAASKDVAANGNASTTQVVMGNDTRLTDARKASDVSAWAKSSTKPNYTKSEVGLSNVPNVATNDQTPSYTESTTLAKLTSGEKLSVAFGKISKAVTDLISHIGNTSNPHGVTKSQVGLGNVENKSSATIRSELTKENVTTALGYTPPTTNTTYGVATASALGLVKSGTDITIDSSGNVSVNDDSHNHVISNVDGLQSALDGKADSSHTHNYAGSSSAGGSATSAVKLDSSAGSATQPVYFSGGKPVACSYTLGKSVPSNAVFTDTNTWRPLGTTADTACAGNDSRLSNARPASDVYAWAKASTKPSYTKSEVGLSNVDNTADSAKSVKYATSAGSASKVNGHTVNSDVPANAKFTDTWRDVVDNLSSTRTDASLSANQGRILGAKLPFALGIDADGNYGYYKAGADTVTPFKTGDKIINSRFPNGKSLVGLDSFVLTSNGKTYKQGSTITISENTTKIGDNKVPNGSIRIYNKGGKSVNGMAFTPDYIDLTDINFIFTSSVYADTGSSSHTGFKMKLTIVDENGNGTELATTELGFSKLIKQGNLCANVYGYSGKYKIGYRAAFPESGYVDIFYFGLL